MSKLGKPRLALTLSVAALAAAGCGSSSTSKTKPVRAPVTPSTSATSTGTTSAVNPAQIKSSTPIGDPAVRSLIIAGERQVAHGKATEAQLNQLADCVIKKYEAAGVTTAGQLESHQAQAKTYGAQCGAQLKLK